MQKGKVLDMAENTRTAKGGAAAKKAAKSFRSIASGKPVFAFDFGEYAVKVAVLKLRRNNVEVRHLFSVENKENLSKLDMSNVRAWRSCIQKAFSQRSIIADDHLAICTIGGKNYIHRQLEIPYVDEADRNGIVENEMSQLLALDPGSYVFQHELISVDEDKEDKEEKSCKVWAVAMPQELCTAAYDLLKAMKLKPVIMDVHVNGIKRFFQADDYIRRESKGQTVACIDYGMTHTEIMYLRGGKLLGETVLDAGDGRLVSEARNAVGFRITDASNPNKIIVSPQDICNILNKAHATPEEKAFSLAVKEWLSKVNTAITRFNFEHQDEPVSRIYLYGGSPQNIWLVQYLASVTGIQADLITDSALFNTDTVAGEQEINLSGYLNVLNLSLMD